MKAFDQQWRMLKFDLGLVEKGRGTIAIFLLFSPLWTHFTFTVSVFSTMIGMLLMSIQ